MLQSFTCLCVVAKVSELSSPALSKSGPFVPLASHLWSVSSEESMVAVDLAGCLLSQLRVKWILVGDALSLRHGSITC